MCYLVVREAKCLRRTDWSSMTAVTFTPRGACCHDDQPRLLATAVSPRICHLRTLSKQELAMNVFPRKRVRAVLLSCTRSRTTHQCSATSTHTSAILTHPHALKLVCSVGRKWNRRCNCDRSIFAENHPRRTILSVAQC